MRLVWVAGIVRPRIDGTSLGMAVQVEDFHYSLPDRLPLESLFYGHALAVRCSRAVQAVDYVAQIVYMGH